MNQVDALFILHGAVAHDTSAEAWFSGDPLRQTVRPWYERARACGPDVGTLIHDGAPTLCVEDAAFAYVNAFTAHAAIGFFHGAALSDPERLLEGSGKRMRHVKLRYGRTVDETAIGALIDMAYADIKRRMGESA